MSDVYIKIIFFCLVGVVCILLSHKNKCYLFSLCSQAFFKLYEKGILFRLKKEAEIKQNLAGLKIMIREDIPRQARKVLLLDRLNKEEEILANSYPRYLTTKKELEKISQEEHIGIPENIIKEIEAQILPEYYRKQEDEKCKSMLAYISYISAFFAFIPFFDQFSKYIMILAVFPSVKLIFIHKPLDKAEHKQYYLNIISNILLVILLLFNIYLAVVLHYHWWTDYDADIVFLFSLILFLIICIFKLIQIKKKKGK